MSTPLLKSVRLGISTAVLLTVAVSCQCSDESDKTDPVEARMTPEQVAQEGDRILSESEGALKQLLLTHVQEDGFEGAVSYCHTAARPLTDSLSLIYNAEVRRTSFRYRNSVNAPDSLDRVVLSMYEENFENNGPMDAVVKETGPEKLRYYKPIRVVPLCLNCHGMPGETLTADLHALILDEYPEDRAVGYEIGDFRGAWVVEFAAFR